MPVTMTGGAARGRPHAGRARPVLLEPWRHSTYPARPAPRSPSPRRRDGTARPREATDRRGRGLTEQTARLLWEACRRDPDPASVRRALAGGADTARAVTAASEHRIGPLLWRALGAAGCLDALGPDRAVLGAMADAFRMEALSSCPVPSPWRSAR